MNSTSLPQQATAQTPSHQGPSLAKRLLDQSSLIVFVVMIIVSAFLSDRFLTVDNITNILRQSVPLGVVSLGLLFVILTGGIDLSVGSLMAIVSVTVALVVPDYGLFMGVTAGILVGTLCGAFLVRWWPLSV